ncbi:STM4015 family protein [Streptomyces sp. NBC_01476]|uniref:STM4015 family protein n=1 Tax=Streptomyces sp. NBC_01476 TaxID=2903881 RepID=UPI002E32028D|nr:STM4015 family protein [Streptomyces sp. NBC_01476]
MTDIEHLKELHGLPAFEFPAPGEAMPELPAPDTVAWRLALDPYGDTSDPDFAGCWERFAAVVDLTGVRALIIGPWGEVYDNDSGDVVEQLVAARDRLTGLQAVFIGDLEMEEAEISWIEQSDVTPLLTAFPGLREFGVRGGTGLRFPPVRHEGLRTLVFQTGGLPAQVVRGVAASELPALEHLELWLGVESYGGDATVDDLAPILAGGRFPALRHLALRNSEIQDEIAAAVASAPVVAQVTSLDLSLGVLTDDGAAALLTGQPLIHLDRLDLHHHFVSEAVVQRVRETLEPAGVKVDLSDPCEPWESDGRSHRFTSVSE